MALDSFAFSYVSSAPLLYNLSNLIKGCKTVMNERVDYHG